MYGVRDLKGRLKRLADDLEFTPLMKRRYRTLSAGQKTRVTLAKALLNEPEVVRIKPNNMPPGLPMQ